MKERKNEPGFLRKLGTVFLALLVTFSSVDRAVFAEGEESDSDIIQETAEVQETAEETAVPEESESEIVLEEDEIESEVIQGMDMPAVEETAEPVVEETDEQASEEVIEEVSLEPESNPEDETITEENPEPVEETEEMDVVEDIPEEETTEENDEAGESLLFVYEAKDAADMVTAVASLSDDDSRRIVANTEEDLATVLDVEGTAVYYEGSYIISLDDSGHVDDAMVTISSLTDASPVRDERMELCADDFLIEAGRTLKTGKTQSLQNIGETGPYVALIDTGVSGYAVDSINLTSDPDGDNNGHGTMMAETILNASEGNAKILSIKAFNDDGTASLSNIYAAIRYAIEADVDIINISAAMPDSENTRAVKEILTEATDKGITVVVAAGNRGTDASGYFPANMGNVITVGAATNQGQVVINSNFGSCVDYYVTALSTSFAAARMTGYLVTGNIDREDVFQWIMPETEIRPEDYMDINSEEYKRMKIAGCWDEEGCYLSAAHDWWLADLGVYLTHISAVDEPSCAMKEGMHLLPADITMPVRLHLTMEFLLHGVMQQVTVQGLILSVHREQSGDRTERRHWQMHMPGLLQ